MRTNLSKRAGGVRRRGRGMAGQDNVRVEPLEPRTLLAFPTGGTEFQVNSYTSLAQQNPAVAVSAGGLVVVAWQSQGQDGHGWGINAQRYDAAGSPLGGEFQVNETATGDQAHPTVAIDADGDFIVAWQSGGGQDGSGYGVFARRYGATGTAIGEEFRANATTDGDQTDPSVAADAAGNFVIAWWNQAGSPTFKGGPRAQMYDASGAPRGQEIIADSAVIDEQSMPSVAMSQSGDWIITWQSANQDGSGWGIYGQRYDRTGTRQGTEVQINSTTVNDQTDPAVAMDAAGNFLVAWTGVTALGPPVHSAVFGQWYNSAGQPLRAEFEIGSARGPQAPEQNLAPSVSADADGDIVVAWVASDIDAPGYEVYARRYDRFSDTSDPPVLVNVETRGDQLAPAVGADAEGDFIIAWQGGGDGSGVGVRARAYDAGIDDAGPVVSEVRASGTVLPLFGPAGRITHAVSTLTVTFSEAVSVAGGAAGPNSVTNLANWGLSNDGADISSSIQSVSYAVNPLTAKFEATLTLSPTIAYGLCRLTAKEKIQDTAGNALDGGYDGIPGGNFTLAFDVAFELPAGRDARVNTWTPGHQMLPAIASDEAGDFAIAWLGDPQGGSGQGIYAQRFSAAGAVMGGEFRVNTYTTGVAGYGPSVAMDAAGDFVVAWPGVVPGIGFGVYARVFDAAGAARGAEFQVNTLPSAFTANAAVAMDDEGNFVVVWDTQDMVDPTKWDVSAQRFTAAGAPQGTQFSVTGNQPAPDLQWPAVAMDADGDFVVSWTLNGWIVAQRFSAAGVPRGPRIDVQPLGQHTFGESDVALGDAGDFVVTFDAIDSTYAVPSDVFARRYDAAGNDLGGFTANSQTALDQLLPEVTVNRADDSFVITWVSLNRLNSSDPTTIYAREFDAAGVADGPEFKVNASTGYRVDSPAVAMDLSGDFFVTWQSDGQDGSGYGVYVRRYTRRGTISGQVFHDVNANGVGETGEGPLAAWKVFADLNNNGQIDAGEPSAVTGAVFDYRLRDVPRNQPIPIRAVPPLSLGAPWELSVAPAPVTLTRQQPSAVNRDFGAFQRASVVGTKFEDLDADGIRDPGEPGLAGWTIYIDQNGNGQHDGPGQTNVPSTNVPETIPRSLVQPVIATSSLNATGLVGLITDVNVTLDLSHSHLAGLSITLRDPAGRVVQLLRQDAAGGANLSNTAFDDQASAAIAAGAAPYSGSFRPESPLSLFNGGDGNGTWTLAVTNTSRDLGSIDAWSLAISTSGEDHFVTDANGGYALSGLRPGSYTAREVQQAGWLVSAPPGGGATVVVTSGGTTPLDFGNWRYGSISGTKFDDFNDSGVRNNGEPGLPDWRIFQDRNGNGLYDTGAARAVASSDVPRTVPAGVETTSTLFASGFAGPVVDADLTLDLSVPHSGAVSAVLVSPSGASVLLFGAQPAQGGDLRNITFDDQAAAPLSASGPPYVGSYRPDQPLSGFAGLDANGTWTLKVSSTSGSFFDQGTLNGWSLTLTTAPEPSVMTGPSGEYTFPSLPPGTYVLREELKGGWHQTMPGGNGSYTVVLSSGQSVAGRDFGNHSNPLVPPPTPAFSITDAGPVIEGDTGTTVATFTVTLAAPSPAALSVDYATSGGNAAAPADFTPASGTLVFQPGETSKTVVVPVNGDTTDERDENFFVILSNPQGGPVPIIDGSASATILDDDDPPTVSVSDASVAEGNSGQAQMSFTLTLSAASEKSLAVSISSTNNTAQAGVDFGGPGGSIVFVPGETSKTINVGVFGDTTPEPDETFFFNLSDPFEVTIGDGVGVGTIVNDDGAVAGPKVTQVYVAGSAWSSAYKQFLQTRGQGDGTFGYAVPAGTAGAQLAVLPWANLDQVSVRFDKDVLVLGSDLDLRGMAVAGGHYAVSAFAYDDLTHTATWTLSQPLRGDKMLLDLDGDADGVADANTGAPLDGDWASGASGYPSGDGSAGGDLRYRLNVLTGDVNGNGSVSVLDWVQERLRTSRSLINPGTGTFAYGPLYDLNGDGRIDDTDMRLVRRNLLRSLPGTDPAMVWLTGAARSVGASGWSVTKNLFSSVPILG